MMGKTLWLLGGVLALYLIFFARSEPVHAKKIVIEVDTPHGIVSGSTVVELKSFQAPWWFPAANKSGTVSQGEALHVDLGAGKHLFLLMSNLVSGSIRDSLMPNRLEPDGSFKPDWVPFMVTFDDISDANSMRQVRPEDFPAVFGSGYSLRSLRAVDTRERATFGSLIKLFPDLPNRLARRKDSRESGPGFKPFDPTDMHNIRWDAFVDKRW